MCQSRDVDPVRGPKLMFRQDKVLASNGIDKIDIMIRMLNTKTQNGC